MSLFRFVPIISIKLLESYKSKSVYIDSINILPDRGRCGWIYTRNQCVL